jgi:hypothetical protein
MKQFFPTHVVPGNEPSRPSAMQQSRLAATIHASPRMVAQRQFASVIAGSPRMRQVALGGGVVQRKTDIKHTASYITMPAALGGTHHLVGHEMTALLDVNHPVVGTATGVNWTWMQELRKAYPAAGVVRGHLLNHDLGGFGVQNNLYPISTMANADHSANVEQKVKGMMLDKAAASNRIYYHVAVKETTDHQPADALFNCTWGWEGQSPSGSHPVRSALGKDKGGFGGAGAIPAHSRWFHGSGTGAKNIKGEDFFALPNGHAISNHAHPDLSKVSLTANTDAHYKATTNEQETLRGDNEEKLVQEALNQLREHYSLKKIPSNVVAIIRADPLYQANEDVMGAVDRVIHTHGLASLGGHQPS